MTESLERIDRFAAPYKQEITLSKALYDSGMELMRVTIREGHRITTFDIDAETALRFAAGLSGWARQEPAGGPDVDAAGGPDAGGADG